MATLSEIIAKRQSMGPNATNVEARQALMGAPAVPSTPTPVAPALSVNQQQRADNIASRQANPIAPVANPAPVAPVAPAPIVQAPVDPTTGLSKPLEATTGQITQNVAPTDPIAQKPVTPKAPSKVEPIVNRQKEIETNLATGYNANPSLFNDRTAFDQAYNYQTKNPEEKATLDSFYNSKQPTISSMYSAILNQQEVPEQTKLTPAYKIAQNRYTKANMYSGMTATQVSSEMRNAKLIEGSQAFEDLKAINPKLVQDAMNLRKVNGDKTNIWTYTNNPDGSQVKTNNLENTFASDFNDNFGDFIKSMYKIQTPEEIRAIIYTPDVKASEDKARSIELDINKIDDSLAQIDRDVEKELAGSGATVSRIAMEKASRRDVLNNQRASLERTYTTYANKANNLITQNTTVFQTQQTQKQAQNAAMMPFITDKYKTAQAKQQAEQALNDPATQIQSTMDEFAKLGIVAQGNTASKIAEFKKSGKTLPEYISGLRAQFMSKTQYQQILAKKAGEGISYQTIGDNVYRQNADGTLTKTNISAKKSAEATKPEFKVIGKNADGSDKYGWVNSGNQTITPYGETGSTTIPPGKSLFDVLGKNVGTYEGNRGYDLAGAMGDPLPAGGNWTVKSVGTAGEQVGSIFIGGKGSKPWGNTVVMQDESGNEIRYSHLQNIGVKQGDILGFGDIVGTRGNTGNVRGANGEVLTAEQLKAGRGAHLDVEIKSGGKLLSNADQVIFLKGLKGQGPLTPSSIDYFNSATPTDKKKLQSDPNFQSFQTTKQTVMNDENASIFDVMKYSQGGKDMGEERLKSLGKFSQGLSQIADLSKAINKETTGPILGTLRSYNPYDSNAQALVAQINSVVPNIARGVYGEVGVLTDADIQNYAKTLPNIKSTEDTNKLVLAMTLKTMLNGFKGQLQIDGSAGRDVSGFGGTVKQYETKIDNLLQSIGGGGAQSNTSQTTAGGEIQASNGKTYQF